jgi:polygalacturonase
MFAAMNHNIRRLLLIAQITFCTDLFGQTNNFNVKNFGAVEGGNQNCATAIQKTIDACALTGGGKVYFPAGKYLTSTFFLKNNVFLYMDAGAEILASRNPADYTQSKGIYSTETDVPCLIMADKLENIGFEGPGKINGQAEHEWSDLKEMDNFIKTEIEIAQKSGIEMKRAYAKDPKVCLFYITNCKNVRMSQITITASPNWAVHLANCSDVLVQGISLYSSLDKGVNSDGLDIDACKNVRIADCHIETGDDAICLKSTNKNGVYNSCENVTVTNCTLISTSTALKIGTESHGDFKNIVFSNSVISNTNRGIGIFVRDGATVDGVIFSNLVIECRRKHFNWWGDGDPIRFVLLKRKPESRLGYIRNVLVSNVIARGQGTSLIAGFEGEGSIPFRNLENIRLDNVHLTMSAEELSDKRATSILKIKQISGFSIRNSSFGFEKTKTEALWSSSIEATNVQNMDIENCQVDGLLQNKTPALKFTFVSDAFLQNVNLKNPDDCYLMVEGETSKRIKIKLDAEDDQKPCIRLGKDVWKKAVALD